MPLFSRHKDADTADRDPEGYSGGPGLKDYPD